MDALVEGDALISAVHPPGMRQSTERVRLNLTRTRGDGSMGVRWRHRG